MTSTWSLEAAPEAAFNFNQAKPQTNEMQFNNEAVPPQGRTHAQPEPMDKLRLNAAELQR